jgi:hypothetical protein
MVDESLRLTAADETDSNDVMVVGERNLINVQSSFIAKIELSTIGYSFSISAAG